MHGWNDIGRPSGAYLAWALCLMVGCASTPYGKHTAGGAGDGSQPRTGAEWNRLSAVSERQAQRLMELEARVALLEAEARRQRAAAAGKMSETVRIGRRGSGSDDERGDDVQRPAAEPAPEDDRPAIALRLHGRPAAAHAAAPMPPLPEVTERLQVAPLPSQSSSGAPAQAADEASPAPQVAYRRALAVLQERDFASAVTAFERFIHRYPGHRLVSSALYWQGEAHYAKRDYASALLAFTQVIERYPESQKAPKALYKLGLCHQRLGDDAAARRCFARLRTQFPDSELAKRTSAEGSS